MRLVRLIALGVLCGSSAMVCAQESKNQPAAQTSKPCALGQDSTPEAPCTPVSAAERFRFPGPGSSTPAAPPVDAPGPAERPSADPAMPSAPAPQSPDSRPSSVSSESDSSSSSSSSSAGNGGDQPSADDEKPATPKLEDKGSRGTKKAQKIQTTDERVTEDIQVANFYRNDGNYAGAYMRVKDAFSLEPDDWEVNLIYAEVAMKIGKKDEALEHYQAYVKLDPNGKKIPEIAKIIQQLSTGKK